MPSLVKQASWIAFLLLLDTFFAAARSAGAAEPAAEAAVLRGHTAGKPVIALDLSSDGRRLASVNEEGQLFLWDRATREPTSLAQKSSVRRVQFTPDGKVLLAGNQYSVTVYDAESGAGRTTFGSENDGNRWWVAPDASSAAVVEHRDGMQHYMVYDVASGELLHNIQDKGKGTIALANGGRLGAYFSENEVRLFDLKSKQQLPAIGGIRGDSVNGHAAFTPNGRVLAVFVSGEGQFWDVGSQPSKLVHRERMEWKYGQAPLFTSDGKALVLKYRLWDTASRKLRPSVGNVEEPPVVSPDHRVMAMVSKDKRTIIADAVTSQVKTVFESLEPPESPSDSYKVGASGAYGFSADSSVLAIGTVDGRIELRPLTTDASGEELVSITLEPSTDSQINSFANYGNLDFAGNGRYVVCTGGVAVVVDLETRKAWCPLDPARPAKPPYRFDIRSAFVKPNEPALVAHHDTSLIKYELNTGLGQRNPADQRRYYALKLSPDQKRLAAIIAPPKASEAQLVILDPANGQQVGEPLSTKVSAQVLNYERLAFSADGRLLAVSDQTVEVHDLETRQIVPTLAQGGRPAIVDNGKMLVIIGSNRSPAQFYDLQTGQQKQTLDLQRGHAGQITDCEFSVTLPLFATTSSAGEVLLRDLYTGDVVARYAGLSGEVRAVAFSPDGKKLAAIGAERPISSQQQLTGAPATLKVWAVNTAARPTAPPALAKTPPPTAPPVASVKPREIASFELGFPLNSQQGPKARFSPGVRYLLAARAMTNAVWGPFLIYDIKERKVVKIWEDGDLYASFQWTPDDRYVVAEIGGGGTIMSLDVTTTEIKQREGFPYLEPLAMAPDGERVALGFAANATTKGPALVQVDPVTLEDRGPKLELRDGEVSALAYSPDGKTLAAGYRERRKWRLALLDPATLQAAQVVEEIEAGDYGRLRELLFSPDGRTLVAPSVGWKIWSLSGEPKALRTSESTALQGKQPLGFAGDGVLVLDPGAIYDITTDKVRHQLQPGEVHEKLSFQQLSPDGKLMVSGDESGRIALWDVLRNRHGELLPAHEAPVRGGSFSPDGRLLTTIDEDSVVKIWSLTDDAAAEE
jgi:WD40 repeat protein